MIKIVVPKEWNNLPLTQVLFNARISSTLRRKIKNSGFYYVNNKLVKSYQLVKTNDLINIKLDIKTNFIPTKIPLHIIYEDEYIVIVNKQANLLMHPSTKERENTLTNAILAHYQKNNEKASYHPIHRLDKNTTGLVVIAKNPYIQEKFMQENENSFFRQYTAIINGCFASKLATIKLPIGRQTESIIARTVTKNGKPAHTNINCLASNNVLSHINIHLFSGRTHQIRVHCAYLGYPLLGDSLYGQASPLIERQALHANKITFIHPILKKELTFSALLPKDMLKIVNSIKNNI